VWLLRLWAARPLLLWAQLQHATSHAVQCCRHALTSL
jgi:hypothetical protein